MARGRLSVLAAASALAAVALTACGDEPARLDRASAEREIAVAVAGEVEPGVDAVRCPDEIPVRDGAEVECDVELADGAGTLPVIARQRDEGGSLDVELRRAVLSDAQVADALRAALRDGFGRSFQVDCGDDGPTVREAGERVTCRARDASSRRSVEVTIDGADGGLSYELVDP
ncbi:MAG: DUF4333 domain-containing protein [Acidimicrobiales bacterium]